MILTFFMDGVKYDMMKEHMPFLNSLNHRPLLSEFGYSCACHATMYTGKYIDEHNTWFIWKRGENSPYKWVDKVPFLKYVNFLPLKLFIAKITNKLSKNSSYSGVPCLVNLPLKYWSLFELSDDVMWNNPNWKKELPNLFTILKENNIKHKIIALHNKTKSDDAFIESKHLNFKELDYVYYFIGYTDNVMHSFGESIESQDYLLKVDKFIEEEYKKAKLVNENVTVIAFSDHGHINIDGPLIDINDYFVGNKKVNDYIHLIESNFVRFWFRNEEEKIEVEKVLNSMVELGIGFIIDDAVKDKYHLKMNPFEQGELIFYLDSPREFTNTIWGFGHSVVSGHGYMPTHAKHLGIFCSTDDIKDNCEFVSLIDILPTILESLNIEQDYSLEGNSLWK